jgi:hypothetical protein
MALFMQFHNINIARALIARQLRKEDAKMDISVRIETRNIPFSARQSSILHRFSENHLFPLIKIVRAVANDGEIINIYVASAERRSGGRYYLVARQIEIIRERKLDAVSERMLPVPFSTN